MEAYVRFYRAISSHWLNINITWTAGVSRYTDFTVCEETFSHIKSLWLDNYERSSINEKIEAIEVTDFELCRSSPRYNSPGLTRRHILTTQIFFQTEISYSSSKQALAFGQQTTDISRLKMQVRYARVHIWV